MLGNNLFVYELFIVPSYMFLTLQYSNVFNFTEKPEREEGHEEHHPKKCELRQNDNNTDTHKPSCKRDQKIMPFATFIVESFQS